MLLHIATVTDRSVEWDVREVVRGGIGSDYAQIMLDDEYEDCDRVVAVFAGAISPCGSSSQTACRSPSRLR